MTPYLVSHFPFLLPTVTGISPSTGALAGGTTVTITGTNFVVKPYAVVIGGIPVSYYERVNNTTIVAVTAARTAGSGLSVEVTTPSGTNVANTLFSYEDPFTPASLSLTGYWDKGNYTAGSWPGLASAGNSLGRNIARGGSPGDPTAVDGEPYFDANFYLECGVTNLDVLFTATAGTMIALFKANVAYENGGANYQEPFICGDNSSWNSLSFSNRGVMGTLGTSGYNRTSVIKSTSVGVFHLAMLRWNGSNLGLTVDEAIEMTTPHGSVLLVANILILGVPGGHAPNFQGTIRTVLTSNTYISDVNYAKIVAWARENRGLP